MKFIVLTNNKIAIVDDDRYDALMKFKWRAVQRHGGYYAKTTIYRNGKRIDISMHRFVAQTPHGLVTHHDNRISLDNRRRNLINMTKDNHNRFHADDNVLIKFAPVTVNPGSFPDRNYDRKQE